MDTDRFDMLTRFLTEARSRRVTLSALLGLGLAALALREAEAKSKKGRRKRKRKSKKKQKPPTCSDRKKNGDETDVDCGGGTCPRCESGKSCAAPTDCQTSYCVDGACQTCQELVEACGSDSSGACTCYPLVGPPPDLEWIGLSCIQVNTISSAPTPSCPSGQVFIATGSSSYGCAKPCGTPA